MLGQATMLVHDHHDREAMGSVEVHAAQNLVVTCSIYAFYTYLGYYTKEP